MPGNRNPRRLIDGILNKMLEWRNDVLRLDDGLGRVDQKVELARAQIHRFNGFFLFARERLDLFGGQEAGHTCDDCFARMVDRYCNH